MVAQSHFGLTLALIIAVIHNGSALRCWQCSSDLDPTCFDHFNQTKILQYRSNYQNNNYNSQYGSQSNYPQSNYQGQSNYQSGSNYQGGSNYQSGSNYQNQNNGMPNLAECTAALGQMYDQKPVCMKKVMTEPNGRRRISRECKIISMRQTVGRCPTEATGRGFSVDFCEYCEYDGCNTATGLTTNVVLATALPCAIMLFFRK